MTAAAIAHQLALGVGVAGALVDVTSYVEFQNPIKRSWGKQDEFRDTPAGAIQFTLNNRDFRFTPGNAAILATPMTEGTTFSWTAGTRVVKGTVRGFAFAGSEAQWGELTIFCDDGLGSLARRQSSGNIQTDLLASTDVFYFWPLTDIAGSTVAAEASNPAAGLSVIPANGTTTFGVVDPLIPSPTLASTVCLTTAQPALAVSLTSVFSYGTTSMGAWGIWHLPKSGSSISPLVVFYSTTPGASIEIRVNNGVDIRLNAGTNTLVIPWQAAFNAPMYLGIGSATTFGAGVWTMTFELFINGTSQGTVNHSVTPASLTNAQRSPTSLWVEFFAGFVGDSSEFARLSHTRIPRNEYAALTTTEAMRLTALVGLVPEVTLGSLPADLSARPIGNSISSGQSILDAVNAVIRTEQGAIYCSTSGTLLAPVETIQVRARQRPSTVRFAFSALTEINGLPQFLRDVIANGAASDNVQGVGASQIVTDPTGTAFAKVGTASTSDTILSTQSVDLLAFGQDRIIRGLNTTLKVVSIDVDNLRLKTDRSADLLALVPGDRLQIASIPAALGLGITSLDGWLLGAQESFQGGPLAENKWTLYLQPVLPATGIFDTNLFMSDGHHTLNAGITSGALSMTVLSSDLLSFFEQVAVPYTVIIDSEQIVVTACGAPVAGVQTLTITRAANGTIAAAHSLGAAVEIATPALFAY